MRGIIERSHANHSSDLQPWYYEQDTDNTEIIMS